MICPYNTKVSVTVTQTVDETNDQPGSQSIEITNYIPLQCPEAGCAAWQNGHCRYRGEPN